MKKLFFLIFFLLLSISAFSQKLQYSAAAGKELFLMDNKFKEPVFDNLTLSILWALDEESSFIWGFESGFRSGEIINCKAAGIHTGLCCGYRWNLCDWCFIYLYETFRVDFLYTLSDVKNFVLLPDKMGYDLVTDVDFCFKFNENFGMLACTGFVMGSTGLFVKMSIGFSFFNLSENFHDEVLK